MRGIYGKKKKKKKKIEKKKLKKKKNTKMNNTTPQQNKEINDLSDLFDAESKKFNVHLFDGIITEFFAGNMKYQELLVNFQQNPNSWQLVDQIFIESKFIQSKLIALGVLNDLIKYKWQIIPLQSQNIIKEFLMSNIIQLASANDAGDSNPNDAGYDNPSKKNKNKIYY